MQVAEVFKKHERLLHHCFTHFAAGVPSLDVLTLGGWQQLVEALGLAQRRSKHCTWEHLEAIFMETDGMRLKAHREEEAAALRIRQSGLAAPVSPNKLRATPRTLGPKGTNAGGGALKHFMSRPEVSATRS